MMNKLKIPHNTPVTLKELNQKLDFEAKRLVREKEDGIASYISKAPALNGISKLVFKNRAGEKVTLSYRLDAGGQLRFALEKQPAAAATKEMQTGRIGRTSANIEGSIIK
jgi:hypothetical protein